MTIVIATHNRGKLREMAFLFHRFLSHIEDIDLVDFSEFPDIPLVEEDGVSFHANARKKAMNAADFTGKMAIGDDSGLEVDALGGAPGILSARYAGDNATDDDNNRKLLRELADRPTKARAARFVCAIAVALPGELLGIFEGVCQGVISAQPRGGNGFGYDPLFIRTDYGKSFAELSLDVKNRISHRARAFEKAAVIIERYIERLRTAE